MNMPRVGSAGLIVVVAAYLGACATAPNTDYYDPAEKFSKKAPPARMQIVGSRIAREVSPDDPSPPTLSPTAVITREELDRQGDVGLARVLRRYAPNMFRDF